MAIGAPVHHRPPAIYRLARALRVLGVVVIVALILFAGTVAYSAFEVARSSPQSGGLSATLDMNGTIQVSGTFTITNSGIYPLNGLELHARVSNASGVFLGKLGFGPTNLASGMTGTYSVALYFPVSEQGPAASLLTEDQYLSVSAWANTTYAYLFPVSVTLSQSRSWGAPFEGFHVAVGAPTPGGGGTVIFPVTISFSNHASFTETGVFVFTVVSSNQVDCGGGSFYLSVPPQTLFDQTTNATLSSGCSPMGGELLSTFSLGGTPVPLPPQGIP